MVDPLHFDRQAANYEQARPPYPEALWHRLEDLGLLTAGRHAVDLGAGTGQATGRLLEAGLTVTAVEPGARLAALLKMNHPAASVIVSRTEDADLPEQAFDIAVAATSIHWMNLDELLPKVHASLRPGGKLLVWRNVFGDPTYPTPFRTKIGRIVAARTGPPRPGPDAEDAGTTGRELVRTGLFSVDEVSEFRWEVTLDAQQVQNLFSTFSDWNGQEVLEAAAAAVEAGGSVVEHYRSWLIVLSRT